MASTVSSGKSARISAPSIPEARYSDAKTPDARLAAPFSGFDGDAVDGIGDHVLKITDNR
jgi:hypothetical protein